MSARTETARPGLPVGERGLEMEEQALLDSGNCDCSDRAASLAGAALAPCTGIRVTRGARGIAGCRESTGPGGSRSLPSSNVARIIADHGLQRPETAPSAARAGRCRPCPRPVTATRRLMEGAAGFQFVPGSLRIRETACSNSTGRPGISRRGRRDFPARSGFPRGCGRSGARHRRFRRAWMRIPVGAGAFRRERRRTRGGARDFGAALRRKPHGARRVALGSRKSAHPFRISGTASREFGAPLGILRRGPADLRADERFPGGA